MTTNEKRRVVQEKILNRWIKQRYKPVNLWKSQSVKLQNYTVTPFEKVYKGWLQFWNQFKGKGDIIELLKGKPRDDILGLSHTVQEFNKAKKKKKKN